MHMVHDLQRTGQSNRNMLLGVIPTTDLKKCLNLYLITLCTLCVCNMLQVVAEYCTADSSAERQWEACY